ncbi:MAG: 50S ribosomal protein L11 methyltransferase [Xanthobacteraceae bacterium]|jgi:ribosomal protein L11 methyltransferase
MPAASTLPAGVVARLTTDRAAAHAVGDALAESFDAAEVAASSVEEADGRWSLAVHFRDRPNETAVRALVALAAGAAAANALTFEPLAAQDWVRASLESLAPVDAGRFVVHGAHDRDRVPANRIAVEIAAALAFGTGHHGTTRGCLLALDRIVKLQRGRRGKVLDVGTGSGVLAIAAAKTLRRPVLASDIDARAVTLARDNARLNRVGGFIEVAHATGLDAGRFRARAPFALVFANILLDPLRRLATPMARLVAPGGRVVLSGLLAAQGSAALAAYRARGLVLERRIPLEGWVTLVLRRPAGRTAVAALRRAP